MVILETKLRDSTLISFKLLEVRGWPRAHPGALSGSHGRYCKHNRQDSTGPCPFLFSPGKVMECGHC